MDQTLLPYQGAGEFFGKRLARNTEKAAAKALWSYLCNNCDAPLSRSKLRVVIQRVRQEILLCDECKGKYEDWTEKWSSNGSLTRNYRPKIDLFVVREI
jgi:ribosomal protein L37AE/L43A